MIWLISIITFIFPLFFFPWITEPVFAAKNFFLAAAMIVVLVTSAVSLFKSKKLTYSIKGFDFLIGLFLLSAIVSWFFLPIGSRVRSLTQSLGIGTIISLSLLYFSVSQIRARGKTDKVLTGLILSGALMSLVAVILFVVPGSSPSKIKSYLSWLSFGSPVVAAQFLVILSVFLIYKIFRLAKKKEQLKQWWLLLVGVILLVGAGVTVFQSIKGKPVFLDWFSSWAIAVESFKRKPITGVGPGNFNVAFNLYRPIEFNQNQNWNFRFGAAHSWILNVWAEMGLVGLVILGLILVNSFKLTRKKEMRLLLGLIWLSLIFLPGNFATIFILFLVLALARGKGKEKKFSLLIGEQAADAAPVILTGLLMVLSLTAGYFVYRGFSSETLFFQAIKAASENRGGDTYNLQLETIQKNRNLAKYRISFSQTNLALANSLASKGEELTDEERQQVSQLISQAVSEAKAAVALEPRNVVVWENLSQTYRQLINVAEGADQWVFATYQQAIALDAFNPRLRLDFGGLYYGFGQHEQAARQFEIAVNLKSDYANAWYNWAWALKQQDKLEDAVVKMQQAVALTELNTPDYEKADAELDEWRKELGEAVTSQVEGEPTELIQPQPLPSPKLEEPIQLPDEAAPPLEEIEPTPVEAEPTLPAETP